MVNDKLPIKQTNQQKNAAIWSPQLSEEGNLSNKHNEMSLITV